MKRACCIAAALIITATGAAQAAGNAGGVLAVHTNGAVYSAGTDYSGQSGIACEENFLGCDDENNQPDCSSEIATLNPAGPAGLEEFAVFYVMAAFPTDSCPRLSAVTFGINNYNENNLIIAEYGSGGDFEIVTANWPRSSTGTAVTWNNPETAELVEVYWFAAYAYYSPGALQFGAHPTQGGNFADDTVPSIVDPILGYGAFGLGGDSGSNPSPVVPVLESSWGEVKKVFSENE